MIVELIPHYVIGKKYVVCLDRLVILDVLVVLMYVALGDTK